MQTPLHRATDLTAFFTNFDTTDSKAIPKAWKEGFEGQTI
jgi:hypothetical protein